MSQESPEPLRMEEPENRYEGHIESLGQLK